MIKYLINKFLIYRQAYFKKINKEFYSQFGEDKILFEIIPKNLSKGFYVDVGCFHPKKYSNTYMLHKRGWFGINIDMEEDKIKTFNLTRPNDFNYLGAISDKIETVKIYRNQQFGVSSTINKDIIKNDNILDEIQIKTNTLNNVLELSPFKDKEIDLLNIDTEGNDFKVLKSLNLNAYNPKIIIIETHLKNINEIILSEQYKYLIDKKYRLSSWNIYSLIFIKENFKF
jgi:FkbM family methyltransferase